VTHNSFSYMFIPILYMFRAATCPSSGELIVSIRRLAYVTLYRWPFGVQVWMRMQSHPNLHTKRSSVQLWTQYIMFKHTFEKTSSNGNIIFVTNINGSARRHICLLTTEFERRIRSTRIFWIRKYVTFRSHDSWVKWYNW